MADERSMITYSFYQKAAQQFDYAVTGATGAVCTYILQTFKPRRVDFSPCTLETVALLVLIASVVLGFKLLESKVTLVKINTSLLDVSEELGTLAGYYSRLPAVNVQSDEVLTPEKAAREIALLREKSTAARTALDHRNNVCGRLYVWRNRCLASGFLLLVLARLSAPYWQE
jgi:hypothetical protein